MQSSTPKVKMFGEKLNLLNIITEHVYKQQFMDSIKENMDFIFMNLVIYQMDVSLQVVILILMVKNMEVH
jgi:hypothetical protein